jgi:IS605 OrfB family transposase
MAGELYRTYEVLVEESVLRESDKDAKTNKESRYKAETMGALRDTNDMFQDAVCYYTILLAGLAGDAQQSGRPLNPLWAELCAREKRLGNEVKAVLMRLASNYPTLQRVESLDDFVRSVLTKGKSDAERRRTYEILEADLGKGEEDPDIEKLTMFAHDNGLRLCSTTSKRKMPGSAWLDRLYWTIHDAPECHQDVAVMVKKISEFREQVKLPSQEQVKEHYQAAFSQQKCNRAKQLLPLIEGQLATLQSQIEQASSSDSRFLWLHRSGPVNPMAYLVARFLWLQNDAALAKEALADLAAFINKPGKMIAKPVGDESEMPSKFPYFTERCLGIKFESPAFREKFDDAALAMAFEDVFKYKKRTQARAQQVAGLRLIQNAFEGDKETKFDQENSPTGKAMTIRGMKGDARWRGDGQTKKGIETLLSELAETKELDRYGLRSGTIGGWADLRKRFRRLEKFCAKKNRTPEQLGKLLELAVEREQRENRQGFGSADFFNKLCEPQYHHLWSATSDGGSARDFISDFVDYSEWMEELSGLETRDESGNVTIKPISYTFPGTQNRHKETSYRHFDFKEKLNRQLSLTLFRKHTDNGSVRYELLEDVPVTLSARRLKRDKVMTAEGTSINAVWCPPLVLEEEKPRIGKKKNGEWPSGDLPVSFSLMVEDGEPGQPPPPVHLTVSFPLTPKELERTVRTEKTNWGKSLQWEKDGTEFYGKFFRWKIDLVTKAKDLLRGLLKEKLANDVHNKLCGVDQRLSAIEPPFAELATATQEIGKAVCSGNSPDEKLAKKFEQVVNAIKQCIEPLWHTKREVDFHILSVDLGIRFSSAFAHLRVHRQTDGDGRLILPDNLGSPIRAHVYRKGTLRLQGEDVKKPVAEPYGNDGRGRFPVGEFVPKLTGEVEKFLRLAFRIVPEKAFPIIGVEKMTYPEMGDHLVLRLRRRISRIRSLFSLRWHVSGTMERDNSTGKYDKPRTETDQKAHYRIVVEMLGQLAFPKRPRPEGEEEHPDNARLRVELNPAQDSWLAIKADLEPRKEQAEEAKRCKRLEAAVKDWNWKALAAELEQQLREYFTSKDATAALLEAVVEHCLPLRKRHWRWNSEKHQLTMECEETDPQHIPLIQGMRGLSMRRLEQVLNLRQRCQSFAKLEKRFADGENGVNPPPPMKRGESDDACEDLLDKSNELRDQRVNQTAHMILAEALGLELKSPEEVENKKARKSEVDLHGEYKRILDPKTKQPIPRCSVIVLEDLSRYRTSQDRTRTENSRLMQWSHRQVVKKLTDIAKPFGITIMLVDPAFSSRFHSRSGLPGIRVNSESRGFHEKMPYAAWLKQKNKDEQPSDLAKRVIALKELFEKHPKFDGQLLIAVDGGKEFLPVPGNAAEQDTDSGLMNADENAAINIGLRALAHPDRWDIFPRIRTAEISEDSVRVRNRRGSFAKLADDDQKKLLKKASASAAGAENGSSGNNDNEEEQRAESAQYPDFFINAGNFPGMPESESHAAHAEVGLPFKAYRRGLFLKRVQQLCDKRVEAINKRRVMVH